MSNIQYFINCRGMDFSPVHADTWERSGHIQTIIPPFRGQTSSMDPDQLIFNGSTRISTWLHFNRDEIRTQLKYLKSCGVNLLRIHLDLYSWAALGQEFLNRANYIARLANDHKMYIQWVLFEGDSAEDTSGIDGLGRAHFIGGT